MQVKNLFAMVYHLCYFDTFWLRQIRLIFRQFQVYSNRIQTISTETKR